MKPQLADRELGFRLEFEDLAEIQELLCKKFVFVPTKDEHKQVAEMRRRSYAAAWQNILALAGWREEEFEQILYCKLAEKNKNE